MMGLDWTLTLLSLAIVPLIVGAIFFFARRIRRESTSIQEQESAVLAQAQEGLSSIRWCTLSGAKTSRSGNFNQQAQQSLQANLKLTLTNVEQRAGDQHAHGHRDSRDVLTLGRCMCSPEFSASDRCSFSALTY